MRLIFLFYGLCYSFQAVLAHELGHLKCDHGVWLTFANVLTLGAYTVPGMAYILLCITHKW